MVTKTYPPSIDWKPQACVRATCTSPVGPKSIRVQVPCPYV